MNLIASQFFTFNRPVVLENNKNFVSPNGVRWDQIERWYVDETNVLILVLKSMIEITREVPRVEKNKHIVSSQRVPTNSMISIPLPEDIARFFDAVEQTEYKEEPEPETAK